MSDEKSQQSERMSDDARHQLEAWRASQSELEIPEIFSLYPLFSKRVTVRVRKVESARFSYIADTSETRDQSGEWSSVTSEGKERQNQSF